MKHLGRLTIVVLLFGVSCAGPAASGALTGEPTAAEEAELTDCPQIDLRSPAGNPVNLTGTWYGRDHSSVYYLTQKGSCLWWAGEEETVQLIQLGQPTDDRQQAHPDSRWTRISNVDIPPP